MPALADLLTKLEVQQDLDGAIIRRTKIHKVLRGITKLQNIPRDAIFGFRKRSLRLLEKWTSHLVNEPETPGLLAGNKDPSQRLTEGETDKTNGAAHAHGTAMVETHDISHMGDPVPAQVVDQEQYTA